MDRLTYRYEGINRMIDEQMIEQMDKEIED